MDGQIKGKQIVDGSIPGAKLETSFSQELLKRDGSVAMTGNFDSGNQKIVNLGAPTTGSDAARLQDIHDLNRKEKVRVITTSNITLSGEQTINGVSILSGERVLVGNAQTNPADRGLYVASTGAWSRSADANTGPELTGAVVFVDEGSSYPYNTNFQQVNTITTPGTDAQDWIDVGGANDGSEPSTSNKDMVASVTSSDEDAACATTLAATPAGGSYVAVLVNGINVTLGNGVKTDACYFSSNGGTTPKSYANIAAGDTLYWMGSIAGFELDANDRIDFLYNV